MKKLLFVLTIALAVVSCNKNQKAVKLLDGEWNATSIKHTDSDGNVGDGLPAGLTYVLKFDNCKLKKDEYCGITTTVTYSGSSESDKDVYRVTDDGEKLEIKETAGSTTAEQIKIISLDKTELVLKQTEDGNTTDFTFKKK